MAQSRSGWLRVDVTGSESLWLDFSGSWLVAPIGSEWLCVALSDSE